MQQNSRGNNPFIQKGQRVKCTVIRVVNGQKEKPIFVGMGFVDDSGFLILRIETDCHAAKFTKKQSQERKLLRRERVFVSQSSIPPAFAFLSPACRFLSRDS